MPSETRVKRRYKKRKPTMRKPPPFRENSILEAFSAGVTVAEGFPECSKGRPRLTVRMCAEDAVEKVAKVWGTSVTAEKRKKPSCKPTPENPQGQAFVTSATGERMRLIIEKYRQSGLLTHEFEEKLKKTLRKCPFQ